MSVSKIPLVLVPGLLCDEALWAHQTEHLADVADMTVIDLREPDSMAGMAEAVLDQAPDGIFALAGLSMGGYVAHEIMRLAPERISRLALLNTAAHADSDAQTARRRGLLELAEKGKFKGITPSLLPLYLHESRLNDTALTDAVSAMAERIGKDSFLRQQKAVMNRVDSRPYLEGYTCPTAVIVGRQDLVTPLKASEEMARLIPGAKMIVIESCGHLSTMERPEAATAVLRYWLQDGQAGSNNDETGG